MDKVHTDWKSCSLQLRKIELIYSVLHASGLARCYEQKHYFGYDWCQLDGIKVLEDR